MRRFSRYVDRLSEIIGNIVSYFVMGCIVVVLYEVFMRFVLNASQVWASEMSMFLFGPLFALGGAYTLLNKGHVSMDLLYRRWSPKGQAIMDIVTFVFFLLFVGVLLWKGSVLAWKAIELHQRSASAWEPPLWPIKIMIPLGALLMLLQGLSELIKSVLQLFEGRKNHER